MPDARPKQPAQPAGLHDYDQFADKFAKAAGHEKREIIHPAIAQAFTSIAAHGHFNPKDDKIVDYGCGPFTLSIPFLRWGVTVDGVDTSSEMLKTARETLTSWREEFSPDAQRVADQVRLVQSAADLKKDDYQLAMMNFVHQCAPDVFSLRKMFGDVAGTLKSGGNLIITGAHPEYLHQPHACCEYDVEDSSILKDGQPYTGRIFDETGKSVYELKGDYFWSMNAIISSAAYHNFRFVSSTSINDVATQARKASDPAYFLMHLRKNNALVA
tara:strand:+ start:1126 stop:1938 length:813 start_codon:yes stop_codon:yes gene_type:complete